MHYSWILVVVGNEAMAVMPTSVKGRQRTRNALEPYRGRGAAMKSGFVEIVMRGVLTCSWRKLTEIHGAK